MCFPSWSSFYYPRTPQQHWPHFSRTLHFFLSDYGSSSSPLTNTIEPSSLLVHYLPKSPVPLPGFANSILYIPLQISNANLRLHLYVQRVDVLWSPVFPFSGCWRLHSHTCWEAPPSWGPDSVLDPSLRILGLVKLREAGLGRPIADCNYGNCNSTLSKLAVID